MSPGPVGCLFGFTAIATGSDAVIRDFAERWGPLGICGCNMPSGHNTFCVPRGFVLDSEGLRCPEGYGWEPIATWRRYAQQAAAVIGLASDGARGVPFTEGNLIRLQSPLIDPRPVDEFLRSAKTKPDIVRWQMGVVVTRWLRDSGIDIRFRQELKKTKIAWEVSLEVKEGCLNGHVGFGYLFGVLAMQLTTAVASRNGYYECSNCGANYRPLGRRPKSEQKTYCYDCRRGDRGAKKTSASKRRGNVAMQRERTVPA